MIDANYALTGRRNPYSLGSKISGQVDTARSRYAPTLAADTVEPETVEASPVVANENGITTSFVPSGGDRYTAPEPGQGNLGYSLKMPGIAPTTMSSALKISRAYGPMALVNPQVALPLAAGNMAYNALGLPSLGEVASTVKDTAMTLTDSLGLTSPSEGNPRSDSMLSGLAEKVYNETWGSPSVYSGIGGYYSGSDRSGDTSYDVSTQGVPSAYSGIASAYGNKNKTERDPFSGNGGGRFGGGGGYF